MMRSAGDVVAAAKAVGRRGSGGPRAQDTTGVLAPSAMHKAATKVGSSQVDRPGINHPLFGDFGHTLFAGLSHALLVGINSTSN